MEVYFPTLARVGVLQRVVCAKAESVWRRWAYLLAKLIDERVSMDKSTVDNKDGDFIDILLSVQHEYGLTRERMKALLTVSTNDTYQTIYVDLCISYSALIN